MVADLREMQENQWVSEIWIDKLEFVNTYYHKDIYLKFSFVFPNIL